MLFRKSRLLGNSSLSIHLVRMLNVLPLFYVAYLIGKIVNFVDQSEMGSTNRCNVGRYGNRNINVYWLHKHLTSSPGQHSRGREWRFTLELKCYAWLIHGRSSHRKIVRLHFSSPLLVFPSFIAGRRDKNSHLFPLSNFRKLWIFWHTYGSFSFVSHPLQIPKNVTVIFIQRKYSSTGYIIEKNLDRFVAIDVPVLISFPSPLSSHSKFFKEVVYSIIFPVSWINGWIEKQRALRSYDGEIIDNSLYRRYPRRQWLESLVSNDGGAICPRIGRLRS